MLQDLLHRRPQAWRQRLLTRLGAQMHATSVERGDICSIAILDTDGMVVAWHDNLPDAARFHFGVIGMHVSQFYMPHDVVFQQPGHRLFAACLHGSDTQERWHRRPGGSIFWGITVIEARRLKGGELNGYSHVTRYSQDPRERTLAKPRRPAKQFSACYGYVCHGATAVA